MNKKRKIETIDMVYIALSAVLIAICSWISIPTTVPFTMQTFAIFCILSMFGGKRGLAAIILYLILGAIGIPVFAQFTSGIGIILGSTGGYMVGFIFIALIYQLIIGIFGKKIWTEVSAMVLGLLVCYAFGTAWYMFVYTHDTGNIGILTALGWCVVPFIIPDLIKIGIAVLVANRIPIAQNQPKRNISEK